jgi:uncharacterized protein with FMN-binding domain
MPYIIAVIIIAIAGAGFAFFKSNNSVAPTTNTPAVTQNAQQYKNGTYKAGVAYMNPNHAEYKLDVTLTLANNVVTDATAVGSQGAEIDPNAQRFMDSYKAEVVGKNINSLNLSRVGGASLTTNAFNQALVAIEAQAKS